MMSLSSLGHLLAQLLAEVIWGLEPLDHPLIWPLLQTLVPRLWRRHQQLSLPPRCFQLPCRHSARLLGRHLVQCGRAIVHALVQLLVLHAWLHAQSSQWKLVEGSHCIGLQLPATPVGVLVPCRIDRPKMQGFQGNPRTHDHPLESRCIVLSSGKHFSTVYIGSCSFWLSSRSFLRRCPSFCSLE